LGAEDAVRIGAVNQPIGVVVRSILTFLRYAPTGDRPNAISVIAVDPSVAILIFIAVAHLAGWLGGASTDRTVFTRRVKAVGNSVTIVVRAVRALLLAAGMSELVLVVAVCAATQRINKSVVITVAKRGGAFSKDASWNQTRLSARAVVVALARSGLSPRTTDSAAPRPAARFASHAGASGAAPSSRLYD
jgi:hypothetical protein